MTESAAGEYKVGDSVILRGQGSIPVLTVVEVYKSESYDTVTGGRKVREMAEVVYEDGGRYRRDRFPVDALERTNNG